MRDVDEVRIPGLGETQRRLLFALKRRGPSTLGELSAEFDLAQGTLREHLNSLEARHLIERAGMRRHGPGRPRVVYRLGEAGEGIFPNSESELLAEFVEYLQERGHGDLIDGFFHRRTEGAYAEAAPLVEQLPPEERERRAISILRDAGFMPELRHDETTGESIIQLCNCPLRSVIAVTRRPCVAEEELVARLVGGEIERFAYMPDGADSCSYRVRRPDVAHPDAGRDRT